jgi:hypothetical protein
MRSRGRGGKRERIRSKEDSIASSRGEYIHRWDLEDDKATEYVNRSTLHVCRQRDIAVLSPRLEFFPTVAALYQAFEMAHTYNETHT